MKTVFAIFLFLLPTLVSAQGNCDCEIMDSFLVKRYYEANLISDEQARFKQLVRLKEKKSPKCNAFSYQLKAEIYLQVQHFEACAFVLNKEKNILDSLHCGKFSYIENILLRAELHQQTNDQKSAIKFYQEVLYILRKEKNPSLKAKAKLGIAHSYELEKNKSAALSYLIDAQKDISSQVEASNKSFNVLQSAESYFYHFSVSNNLIFLDSAISKANQALTLAKKYQNPSVQAKAFQLLSKKAYIDRDFNLSLQLIDSALQASPINDVDKTNLFTSKSNLLFEMNAFDQAYQNADSALFYARNGKNPYKVAQCLENLYNCSKLSGDYERALIVYEDLSLMRDSITRLKNKFVYNELEDKFQKIQQEKTKEEYLQDLELLNQRKENAKLKRKLIIIGSIVLIVLLYYIFYVLKQRNKPNKETKKEINDRLKLTRLNPKYHVLGIEEINNAVSFSEKWNHLTRYRKRNKEKYANDFVTLDKELSLIKTYIDLQIQKTSNSFSFLFEKDETIQENQVCIPVMLLLPIFEDLIETSLHRDRTDGEIRFKLLKTPNNEIVFVIQDNGRGVQSVDTSRLAERANERLVLMNAMVKGEASFVLRGRQSGGTLIEFFLPILTTSSFNEL